MTVQELIDELEKIKDKDRLVYIYDDRVRTTDLYIEEEADDIVIY